MCGKHYVRWRKHGDPLHGDGRTVRGRSVDGNGYARVYTDDDGRILEHRLVMSLHLGRKLERFESVHHVNGIKTDNRIENLELWASVSQPPGQRVVDLVRFAKEVLALYGDDGSLSVDNGADT